MVNIKHTAVISNRCPQGEATKSNSSAVTAAGFSANATFIKTWAAVASENVVSADAFVINCAQLFPPQDILSNLWAIEGLWRQPVTKRFVFDASNIAALRAKGTADAMERPTQVEAVVAWIWAAVIAAARERNKKLKTHLMSSAVNLRKRMIPSLPSNSIGNIFYVTTAKWIATSEAVDYNFLTCRVRESVRSVTDEYVRKMHENGEYIDFFKKGIESLASSNGETEWLTTSSWCKFPLYEADFGWGKPTWVATCVSFVNSVTLIDTGDGEGIEAWVGLTEEDMDKLDHNSEFLYYVSSSIAA
ncbi:hypothetical protein RJ640_016005 [Escallonia rubra]|uniref:Uncharacterized protein n=1 Tax=Escallonia rubra TaxID=112253 RepID=A0AA88RPZ6_9ASTE|nr:hypothetical protein RJ640_016005 [Escallonia rubra]